MTVLLVGCSAELTLIVKDTGSILQLQASGRVPLQWNETTLAMEQRHLQAGVGGHWKAFRIYGLESS